MNTKLAAVILLIFSGGIWTPVVRAQEPAPQAEREYGNYVISGSTELGAQFLGTDGSFRKYRSDLNYNRGFRLFETNFMARSKDNTGVLFDTLRVNTFGFGRDPNKYLRIEAERTKWYRFDMNYRRFEYFNNLTNLALNQHTADTVRKFGDFNLTILPQNQRIKFYLGYTFDRSNGNSALTYDYSRDEFPILSPVRTVANDYRIGADAKLWVFDLSFLQGFRYSKEDSTYSIKGFEPGNNPTNRTFLNTFRRELPTRGRLPFTRLSVHTLIKKKLDFTGRYIYTSGTTRYTLNETLTGRDFSGNNVLLDRFNITGNAKRPFGMGDIGASFFATDKLTISETFRVNNFRINGGDNLRELLLRSRTTPFGTTILPPLSIESESLRLTGYRQFLNTIEADYRFHPRFSMHGGYRYGNRRVELGELDAPPAGELDAARNTNHTNSGFFGLKARPISIWTVYFDFEHGNADNVFFRTSNYDFTNFVVRTSIKPRKNLTINGSVVTRDNTNPNRSTVFPDRTFAVDLNSRIFSTSVDWSPSSKFSMSAGYTHTRLDTNTGIVFFINRAEQSGTSRYFSRDNFVFVNTFVQLLPRVSMFVSYHVNKDLGQGDRVASSPNELLSSFPLTFQSAETKLSIKLREHVNLNLGWKFYNYREELQTDQNYRANLPYATLRFGF